METNRLRQLCAVVETGSLREAARLLHVSHSGLSKSLKVLEEELGTALFQPSGRGIVVTDAGRRVYASAKKVLVQAGDLLAVARGEQPERGPVRIATFEVFSTYVMGELVAHTHARAGAPAIQDRQRWLVREAIPGAIEEALVNEEVDLGITYIPAPRVELDIHHVARTEMAVYGRLERFGATRAEELPFCAPTIPLQGATVAVRGLDGWPDERSPRRIAYACDMMETALELARRGLGVVYLPLFVAALHNRIVDPRYALERLPMPKAVADVRQRAREVSLIKRRSTEEGPLFKQVAKVLRDVCRLKS